MARRSRVVMREARTVIPSVRGAEVSLAALLPELLDPKARARAFAEMANDALGQAQAINRAGLGKTPEHEAFADGRKVPVITSVEKLAVFEFKFLEEVLTYIRAELAKHSPVGRSDDPRPGHPRMYQTSHMLIIDGRVVQPGAPIPELFQEAVFASTVPYARKIERGLSPQAASVYDAVAFLADRRFGNVADIRFGWRAIQIGAVDQWARSPTGRRRMARRPGRRDLAEDWLRRQPSIIVKQYGGRI